MTAKLDGTSGLLQQYDYQVLTTAFSYTFAAGTNVLVINPAGTLATGTITMPASPADGMTISFSSTQSITALTVAGNTGQSIVGNPSTMLAGGAATFVYRLSNTTWYAQANTAQVGSAGSPAPVVTIYTSPSPWTKPATLKAIKVTMVAGGGGGAGGTPASSVRGGNGGNGGVLWGYAQTPAIPAPVTITVGAAGTAGTSPAGSGGSGGTSSFGAVFSTTGGGGGAPGASNGASGGSFAITPAPTSSSLQITNPLAAVVQAFGIPAQPTTGGAPGTAGTGYGAGGGGGSGPSPNNAGAAGTAGFVIVEEFY